MRGQGSLSMPLWRPVPPSHQPQYFRVVWPLPKRPIQGYVLAQQLEGCWTHPVWDGKKWRTPPCVGRENGCDGCGAHARYRWQGYLPFFCPKAGRSFIAQVTKEAARNCPLMCDPRNLLRGRFLKLSRLGAENNSIVKAEFFDNAPPADLPPCPDVREALLNLWGLRPVFARFDEKEVEHGS